MKLATRLIRPRAAFDVRNRGRRQNLPDGEPVRRAGPAHHPRGTDVGFWPDSGAHHVVGRCECGGCGTLGTPASWWLLAQPAARDGQVCCMDHIEHSGPGGPRLGTRGCPG